MPNEPGKYWARAAEWAWGLSSEGNEQLAIAFDFIDHPGHRMTAYLSFTDAAFDYSLKKLRNCGWQGNNFDDMTGLDANEVQLVVDWEEYQGKRELRIGFINAAGGIALKQVMEPAQRKTFADRMRAKIDAADAAAGRPTAGQRGAQRVADSARPPV